MSSVKSALNLWKSSASHWKARCSGTDDQHALGEPELAQPGEHEPRLDGLAEADLVGEDEARHPVAEDPAGRADLVREDVDARGEERAEPVRAPERLEPDDLGAERERGGPPACPEASASSGPPTPLLDRRVVRDLGERRIAPRDDGDPVPPREADRERRPSSATWMTTPTPQPRWARCTTFIPGFQTAIGAPLTIPPSAGPARRIPREHGPFGSRRAAPAVDRAGGPS